MDRIKRLLAKLPHAVPDITRIPHVLIADRRHGHADVWSWNEVVRVDLED
jgi:hypothetical protein